MTNNRTKQILIYAFKPFGKNNINISEEVLKMVTIDNKCIKKYLKTRFDKTTFLNLIDTYDPDIIIGLGQYPRGKRIRIETKAINFFGSKKSKEFGKIDLNGSDYLESNLIIKPDENSIISTNAGRFVCNFSMYVLLRQCLEKNIKFGFLHIPKGMDKRKVVEVINGIILCLIKI